MANYTFETQNTDETMVVRVIRTKVSGEQFEASVSIAGDQDGLTVGILNIHGRLLRAIHVSWDYFVVAPSTMIAALEQENKQLRDRVHELERSAGLRA